MIAIIDYGMGNLRSVQKGLGRVGYDAVVTRDVAQIQAARGVVLPGVGAMPKAMEAVRDLGLDDLLRERVAAGIPVIGLCMGMQLLFESTTELGGAGGIGLLAGTVEELRAGALKVPQIGWNPVDWERESPLITGLPNPCPLYHANSFAPRPADGVNRNGIRIYGDRFVAVVARPHVYGLQSHPEKSGPDGLRLVANFAGICATAAVA